MCLLQQKGRQDSEGQNCFVIRIQMSCLAFTVDQHGMNLIPAEVLRILLQITLLSNLPPGNHLNLIHATFCPWESLVASTLEGFKIMLSLFFLLV